MKCQKILAQHFQLKTVEKNGYIFLSNTVISSRRESTASSKVVVQTQFIYSSFRILKICLLLSPILNVKTPGAR